MALSWFRRRPTARSTFEETWRYAAGRAAPWRASSARASVAAAVPRTNHSATGRTHASGSVATILRARCDRGRRSATMSQRDRKTLVTGGAGFLGSHLCDRLIDRGDDVLSVDNFFTGTNRTITRLLANPPFQLPPP